MSPEVRTPRAGVPPLVLERYLCGEASADERARVEAAYAAAELGALRAADAALRERLASSRALPGVWAHVAQAERQRGARRAVLGLAAAAALALVFVPRPDDAAAPTDRAKGLVPELRVYRRTSAGPERLAPDARVRAHDVLQLAVLGAGRRCAAVVSADGRGTLTWHVPDGTGAQGSFEGSGETFLPHAYELDDAPDFERFWLVLGPCPLDTRLLEARVHDVLRDPKARATGKLALPAELVQAEARVLKEAE